MRESKRNQGMTNRSIAVPPKASRYTINENCLGVTMSGAEIDAFEAPSDDT